MNYPKKNVWDTPFCLPFPLQNIVESFLERRRENWYCLRERQLGKGEKQTKVREKLFLKSMMMRTTETTRVATIHWQLNLYNELINTNRENIRGVFSVI